MVQLNYLQLAIQIRCTVLCYVLILFWQLHECYRWSRMCIWLHKSIFVGDPKRLPKHNRRPPKTQPAFNLGLRPKKGPYRRPKNRAGAWASSINEPALPCRPLCGRILSGAPAHRGSANPTLGAPLAATPLLSRRFLPPETSHRYFSLLFPAASFPAAIFHRGAGFPLVGSYK
jgi:hypothetical protein